MGCRSVANLIKINKILFLYIAELTSCDQNPCKNGGACDDSTGTFVCTCPGGYAGIICEDSKFCQSLIEHTSFGMVVLH